MKTEIKLLNKYNIGKEKLTHQEKMTEKKMKKNNLTFVLTVLNAKNEKIYPAYVSKNPQSVKNKFLF